MPRDGDAPPPVAAALAGAGLVHSSDEEPGIRRRRAGRSFAYFDPQGRRIADEATLARIRALVIPPAYRAVWICADPAGHLQATGRDMRGRKQYRYHPRWREVRDAAKFGRMRAFGRALPRIRRAVDRDLGRPGLSKEKVVAAVVRLLERTLIRVGNDRYAAENGSFGLTTLRKRHAAVAAGRIRLEFRGKGGRPIAAEFGDRRIARLVAACRELPGQRLFQYLGADGDRHAVGSEDVNAYLKAVTGDDFSAKDFRTWAATLLAACHLAAEPQAETDTDARRAVVECVRTVAARLANTPAVCRRCYIHPGILDAYAAGRLPRDRPDETAMLRLLDRLERTAPAGGRPPRRRNVRGPARVGAGPKPAGARPPCP
ncbi:DNA topoisomerase [Allostella sp. ATCC 35155]|nr:DNA topoisomerase [Stella sp. ATCC 35155]